MKNLFILLLLIPTLTIAQDRYTFAIYPECPYSSRNEDIKNCFLSKVSTKLKEDIDSSILTLIQEKSIKKLIIYFNVEKDGKMKGFKTPSYSDESLTNYFREKFTKLTEELDEKGLKVVPAMFNGVPGKIELSTQIDF